MELASVKILALLANGGTIKPNRAKVPALVHGSSPILVEFLLVLSHARQVVSTDLMTKLAILHATTQESRTLIIPLTSADLLVNLDNGSTLIVANAKILVALL